MSEREWSMFSAQEELGGLIDRIHQYRGIGNRMGYIERARRNLIKNSMPDGIRIRPHDTNLEGWAFSIKNEYEGIRQKFRKGTNKHKKALYRYYPVRYEIEVKDDLFFTEYGFSVLVHELAHIYCGHAGSQDGDCWPDRSDITYNNSELEAECVAYLVCRSLDVDNTSREYLSDLARENIRRIPDDNLAHIVRAANKIEKMCGIKSSIEKTKGPRQLYVDTILLDGKITFLIPEYDPDGDDGQHEYTGKSLGMDGRINGGYWLVQANSLPKWRLMVDTIKILDDGETKDRSVRLTKESWENINKTMEIYQQNIRGSLLNQTWNTKFSSITKLRQRLTNRQRAPKLNIHAYVQESKPGLMIWINNQSASTLSELKRHKVWKKVHSYEEEYNFLYKIVKTTSEAERFLEGLKHNGWQLYSYWYHDEYDVQEVLKEFESR